MPASKGLALSANVGQGCPGGSSGSSTSIGWRERRGGIDRLGRRPPVTRATAYHAAPALDQRWVLTDLQAHVGVPNIIPAAWQSRHCQAMAPIRVASATWGLVPYERWPPQCG